MQAVTITQITIDELKDMIVDAVKENVQTTPQPEQEEKFLNIQQAAYFLQVAVSTIYSKVSKGEIPSMKRAGRLYFSDIELRNYLKQGEKSAGLIKKSRNVDVQRSAEEYLNRKM